MRIVGIDYSYTSPAMAWMDYSNKFCLENVRINFQHKSAERYINFDKNIIGCSTEVEKEGIDRFIGLARQSVAGFLFDAQRQDIYVALEDYSFGSRNGRSFTIGENCGILKANIRECSGTHLRLYSPTLVKRFVKEHNEDLAAKFSDGKLKKDGTAKIGALKKEAMHEIFCWKFNIDLSVYFDGMKKYKSPLSDIVDALWILYLHWCEWKIRNNDIDGLTDQEVTFIRDGVDGEGFDKRPFEF